MDNKKKNHGTEKNQNTHSGQSAYNHSQSNTYSFVNPYNFIPLWEKTPAFKKEGDSNYTGVIEYSLKTVTPLFIPNTSNENAFALKGEKEHKSYDFFSYKDLSDLKGSIEKELPNPVIPGSEMRGMLRNHYEILTNSCMSAVDDDFILSKRTQEKYKAGLLERIVKNNETVMYRVIKVKDDCLLRTKGKNSLEDEQGCWEAKPGMKGREEWGRQCYIQEKLKEGTRVTFRIKERTRGKSIALDVKPFEDTGSQKGRTAGYIIKGKEGPDTTNGGKKQPQKQHKHCAHIFREPAHNEIEALKICKKTEFDKKYLESILDTVLDIYDKNTNGAYKEYIEQYKAFKKGKGNKYFPVYYSTISYGGGKADSLLLSPACITREIYTKTFDEVETHLSPGDSTGKKYALCLSDLARNKRSCEKTKTEMLCPACALFGTFRRGKEENITSRIRVTDLECLETDLNQCFDKKPITLQPLSQPKFNPEFYMKKPEEDAVFWTYAYYVDSKGKLHKNEAGINGRKFYWHHDPGEFDMNTFQTEDRDQMNKTIRPLKAGVCFKGRIYFKNLSMKELNTVCYLINAGEDADTSLEARKHGYKLGAAKPFGFGSVAMHVDQVLLRRIEKTREGGIALKEDADFKPDYKPENNNVLIDQRVLKDFEKMTDFYTLHGEHVNYPRKKQGGDIFEWFTKNHKGYGVRSGQITSVGMPDSRNKMLFDEYLDPMTPKTVSNELEQKIFQQN